MRHRGVVLAVVGAALALPAPAHAIDHVSLQLHPSAVPGKPAWRLTGTAPGPEFFGGNEILGVTLARAVASGRGEESHGLRVTLRSRTLAFDGRQGTWRTRGLGNVLAVNMRIASTGAPRSVSGYLGCLGDFAEQRVVLRGTFVLRTRTRYFGSVRRASFHGVVTYNRGGAVDCSQPSASACTPWTLLSAAGANGDLSVGTQGRSGYMSVAFRERLAGTAAVWYHAFVLRLIDTVGSLPTIEVRVPSGLPLSGGGTFSAHETAGGTDGACGLATTSGSFVGSFDARFAGWGLRTLALNGSATYRVGG